MKNLKTRLLSFLTAVVVLAGTLTGFTFACAKDVYAADKTVDVIFSTDVHSHLASFNELIDSKMMNVGGMARISTYIKNKKSSNPDALLVDAGDYPMGTLYQAMFSKEAFEYQMLSMLGYDALTFGNHDFDYDVERMALQFEAAKERCDYYPDFLICNFDLTSEDEDTKRLCESMEGMNLKEYAIYERNGLKIGVTGVFGYDALACAPTFSLSFLDPIESVKATVAKMKKEENPDFIMVISHSGTSAGSSKEESEDENIAKAVPDIDFILSGHAHRLLPEIIKIGNTYIGSNGCYGDNMGFASFTKNANGRFDITSYEITRMDESIEEDEAILSVLEDFDKKVDEEFLKEYGYTSHQIIGYNPYDFASVDDLYHIHDDHNLGQFIADAYRWQMENINTGNDDRVAVTLAPAGTIRASLPKGDVDVSEVYEMYSLGIGHDGTVGFPLVEAYLTGEELITACEIDASLSDFMSEANLYFSGMVFEFNPHALILNKTKDVRLENGIATGDFEEVKKDKLYRVVTDLYTFRMLGAVKTVSKNLISLVPKNKNGEPIVDESECILLDENGKEIKAWTSIANYLQSLDEDGDGIGDVPERYNKIEDRKIIIDSKKLGDVLKGPNKYFWGITIIIVVLVVLIVLIIWLIIKLIRFIIKRLKR